MHKKFDISNKKKIRTLHFQQSTKRFCSVNFIIKTINTFETNSIRWTNGVCERNIPILCIYDFFYPFYYRLYTAIDRQSAARAQAGSLTQPHNEPGPT